MSKIKDSDLKQVIAALEADLNEAFEASKGSLVKAEGDDPVKRALADYQARQATPVKAATRAASAMVTQVRPAPAGGGFGKRRAS